ncbi:MAG TPA: 4Fe-4S binding protein, partial [Bacillota bacterium]|nr:4Fe-4S binding protein [Bacillota bacterium]
AELLFWAIVNILTTAITPFLFGRVLCGWICPNATLQDALYKNLTFRRAFHRLPEAVESQSRGTAMSLSDPVDQRAPYLPFTLLLSWFLVFFLETVFNLTPEIWYPTVFAYGLFVCSLLFPWRKFCTYFCWFSPYRCLAGHNSLWRIRFEQSRCKKCKKCQAEAVCPFYIDIRHQEKEMPATCCLCFSCIDACPYPEVITMKKPKPSLGKSQEEAISNHSR